MYRNIKIGLLIKEGGLKEYILSALVDAHYLIIEKKWDDNFVDSDLETFDTLVLDISQFKEKDFHLLKKIKNLFPDLKILILSGSNADESIYKAICFGANGYICKSEIRNLEKIIEMILNRESCISSNIALEIYQYFLSIYRKNLSDILSISEIAVLENSISGISIANVASKLNLPVYSIQKIIYSIYLKLQTIKHFDLTE
ncbi:MAG TPA: hypothetical protein PK079_14140 [Leptospiraceae bacterium]|nr:hypothetical protein [Leptospiraceae bacterium]HMW04157.1 hypothetical protein [Leptospiraceae bacterium]HMX34865.1 hypothetical protein [Leptospiraceae bacterium]HMY30150.1 hypothetical protein [Leptospiraceae bacterium]HMZ67611.1 hypothetical protein [Leptospiraceae bacterium]